MFQCSSASRKFLNRGRARRPRWRRWFQCSSASRKFLNREKASRRMRSEITFQCSSASRKFLNSRWRCAPSALPLFQCSSASRKFLNPARRAAAQTARRGFSALQRAENSSITRLAVVPRRLGRFSALQRAENSSICARHAAKSEARSVSVLFSEPKIPQLF